MPWVALSVELEAAQASAFSDALLEAGAESVSIEDAEAGAEGEAPLYEDPPGTKPAPSGWRRNRVTALLAPEADARTIVAEAARGAGIESTLRFSVGRVEDDDWVRRSRDQFKPIRIAERLWIAPSWCDPPVVDAIVVRLDPGLAFGTGSHPSTRLALRFLERTLGEMRSDSLAPAEPVRVLDYGCGSGILAIAAAKLGAGVVDAVDVDPQALQTTAMNARTNGVEIGVRAPDALPEGDYNVVVANILAAPLIELAPQLIGRTRARGRLALAGILEAQAQDVIAAYAGRIGLAVVECSEGWALLEGQKA